MFADRFSRIKLHYPLDYFIALDDIPVSIDNDDTVSDRIDHKAECLIIPDYLLYIFDIVEETLTISADFIVPVTLD
jgi:hypothetical protein